MTDWWLWRREMKLWLPPVLLLVVAAGAWVYYRAQLADELESGRRGAARLEEEIGELAAERERLEEVAEAAKRNQEQLVEFYARRLGTVGERLTSILGEVRSLASEAGLDPRAFQYPDEPVEELGLVERSIVFSVDGSWQELRRFIRLLEQSPSFLVLQQISLSGKARGRDLRIALTLSTLFVQEGLDPSRLVTDRAMAEGAGDGARRSS
jgi:Tfp pilus assembly protein PilO